ncbi:MAG: hypothetical protein ACJA0H_001827 [Francisellaceae bacterium]|jgi:hypothetical protein
MKGFLKTTRNVVTLVTLFSMLSLTSNALADQTITSGSSDSIGAALTHAPIGVMGDHVHNPGEWMVSLRYGQMFMDSNYDNTKKVSTNDILDSGYMAAPESMRTYMIMLGMMYGVTDYLTLMAMTSYIKKDMDMTTKMLGNFSTSSEGISDTKLVGMFQLVDTYAANPRNNYNLHFSVGVSAPTGSINQRGDTPMASDVLLGYPMQLGSGTVDPLIGLTYNYKLEQWVFGSQANAIFRFYDNYKNYRLGNEYNISGWVGRNLGDYLGLSFRVVGKAWENVKGAASELNPAMSPVNDPNLRGGERIDAFIGINLVQPNGLLKNNRLAFEFGMPVYQRLDGPQLGLNYVFTFGWQWSF